MENKERQILSEIMELMASVRTRLELLDAKMAELQQIVGHENEEMIPIDLDIDDIPESDAVVSVEVPESAGDESIDIDEPVDIDEPADVDEPVDTEEPADDLPDDDLPFDVLPDEAESDSADEDLPIFADEETDRKSVQDPVKTVEPVVQPQKQAVIDSMTDRQAWRTDMPGTPVKDIRSAISLNDRILFINMLFGQDPMAFQDALTKINQMSMLDEVVNYVVSERPDWNLESETVYRFMMAVRRKVR